MSQRAVASKEVLETFRSKVEEFLRAAEELRLLFGRAVGEETARCRETERENRASFASAHTLLKTARQKRSAIANARAACAQRLQSTPKTVERPENGMVKKEENPTYAQLSAEGNVLDGKLDRVSEIAYKLDAEIGELEREHARILSLLQSLNNCRGQAAQAFSVIFGYGETALQKLQRAIGALSEYMKTNI